MQLVLKVTTNKMKYSILSSHTYLDLFEYLITIYSHQFILDYHKLFLLKSYT